MCNKNDMLETVHREIRKNIDQISTSIGAVPLFGAVGGSVSLNLANESSDIDFYLITSETSEKTSEVIIKHVYCPGIKLDFMCVPIDQLERACADYQKVSRFYPTRFYRNESETERIRKTRDVDRPDFKREMTARIFMADKIFEFVPGSVQKYYERLKKGLLLIDIWDSHFSRAYGNFYEKIVGNDNVLLRKYLYTISELTICYLLLTRKEKPAMNFERMFTPPLLPIYRKCSCGIVQ